MGRVRQVGRGGNFELGTSYKLAPAGDIFTWGDIKTIFLTKEQFEGNYYGYIKMK